MGDWKRGESKMVFGRAAGPFTLAGIRRNWSLIPVVASCGAGVALCASYILYMCTTKPDLVWNNRRPRRLDFPHNDVGPSENRKLFRTREIPVNPEVASLQRDIASHRLQ